MTEHARPARHAVVTGAANGIGAAVCRRFCADGYHVTGVDISPPRPDGSEITITGSDDSMSWITGDLAEPDFAESIVPSAWERWGPVDVVVAAAGIYPSLTLLDLSTAAWDRVFAVNLRSVMQLTRSFALAVREDPRPAVVIHISSGAAQRARPGAAAYSASKAALEAFTRSAALELGPLGFRVNAVSPGFIDVKSQVNPVSGVYAAMLSQNPLGRAGRAGDVAAAVAWLASDEASWVNGSVLRVDGGASAGAFNLPLHWPTPTRRQLPGSPAGDADDA